MEVFGIWPCKWAALSTTLTKVTSFRGNTSQTYRSLRSVHPFCTVHGTASLYFRMGRPSPSKLPLPVGASGPHLIHDSFGPFQPTTQTASRSIQPFCRAVWAVDSGMNPTKYVLGGVLTGATWRIQLNSQYAAAMRSFCQITLTTCYYYYYYYSAASLYYMYRCDLLLRTDYRGLSALSFCLQSVCYRRERSRCCLGFGLGWAPGCGPDPHGKFWRGKGRPVVK